MKRINLKSFCIALALFVCVGHSVAADGVSGGGYVYLNALGWDTTKIAQLAVVWTTDNADIWMYPASGTSMTHLKGTHLYYYHGSNSRWYGNGAYMRFFQGASGAYNDYNGKIGELTGNGNYTPNFSYGINDANTYFFGRASTSATAAVKTDGNFGYRGNSTKYTDINIGGNQKVQVKISTDNGSTWSNPSSTYQVPQAISIKTWKVDAQGSTALQTGSISKSQYSTTSTQIVSANVAYTAVTTVSLTGTINPNYIFDGWYVSNSRVSTESSYSYNATAATTVEARFLYETTYTITIENSVNSTTSTKSVGGTTPVQISAPDIDGYTFSTWSAMPLGVTKTSGNLTDQSIYITATNAATVTANYTAKACKLYKFSAAKNGTATDKGAMTFDADTKAYYKDITTDSKPFYFRFNFNSGTYYSTDWSTKTGTEAYTKGKTVNANSSKVACDQNVTSWDDKPSIVFNGINSSPIRIWFDYQNKKVWITETTYTVNVASGGNGTVNKTSVTAGKNTSSAAITGTPNAGYYFVNWTKSTNNITIANANSASTTVKATSTGTVTANFALRWTVTGSDELNGWTVPGTNVIDHISTSEGVTSGYVDITLLANKDYEMKMYDKGAGSTKHVGYASDMAAGITYTNSGTKYTLNTYSGYNFKFKSASAGSYRFTRDLTNNKLSITYPTSRKITIGTKTTSAGSASADPGDGGVVTAVDNSDNTITDGDYVANNASVTFTAAANYGYSRRGWYSTAECTGEPLSTAPSYTISNITTDKTVYVLFEEALYNVTVYLDGVTATVKEAGVASHPEIVAVVPTGKVFDRWVTTGSAVVGDRFAATTTITSVGDNQSSVTATFKDLPKIYIDATSATGWTSNDMYVVFYKNGGYFDTNNGTGLSSSYVITPTPCKMTKIDGERIWYYEYDPTTAPFAGNTITCVAFVDHTFAANYGNFTSCTVVYRNDFNSCMNMFVVTDDDGINKNTTAYYRNTNVIDGHGAKGYWRNYGEVNSGFYLNNLDGGSFEFTDEDGDGTYTTYVNLDANTDYLFYIGGCNGWNWSNDQSAKPFNYSNPTRETYPYDDDVPGKDGLKSKLTTTEAGYYTFSMTPKRIRALDVTITFPVAANDYRAVYNNAASSPTVTRPSNIIKNDQNSGTISLWLNQGTNYITFQKCNIASGGAVSWPACGSLQTVTGVAKAGVYTMTLTRNGSTYTVSTPVEYTGDFYVRTDCGDGGWRDYQKNVMGENTINYKASDTKTFNYYYCKWVNDPGVNMKAVIANEINPAISDVVDLDDILEDDEGNPTDVLPYAANVRFSYNTATNELKRAYLNGATDWHANFLTLEGNNKTWKLDAPTVNLGTATFVDQNNWIYMLDIKAQGGAYGRLTGTYNDVVQYFVGAPGATIDASTGGLLLGGSSTDKHTIRLTYDFKTNLLLSAWLIDDDNVTTSETIQTDIMFVRKHQEGAKNLTFATGKNITEVRRAYGVMKFNKWILNNQEETGSHNSTSLSQYERDLFFISFPFDVELSDVFGFGTYGVHWIIQYYDGYNRAQKGYWKDSPPNWKFVTSKNFTLKANTGYILALDLDNLKLASDVWNNNVEDVYIYFPSSSTTNIGTISSRNVDVTIDQDGYECTINRGTAEGNRTVKDSYWHIIGVPGYADYDDPLTDGSSTINWTSSSMPYLYEWNKSDNSLSVTTSATFSFKSMHAYMVQYSGTKIHWTGVNAGPASIIARAKASYKDHYDFRLELLQGEEKIDQTYVSLRDDENVTNNFDFNYDLTKEMNANKASLYTMVEGYIQTAGSCLPLETENVTVVPLGIQTIADGEYTFSMPDGTDGVGVTLIDNVRGMRTNLALSDYMVELEAGTYDERFVLEISPIEQIVTGVEMINGENGDASLNGEKVTGVCKKLVDGVLYIVKDGKVFDARGARIQ